MPALRSSFRRVVSCITSNAFSSFDVARKPGVRRALMNRRILVGDPSALQRAANQHVNLMPRALTWPFAHGRAQHTSTLRPHVVKHNNDDLLFKSYCDQCSLSIPQALAISVWIPMIGTSRHRCLTQYPAAISSVKRWSYLQSKGYISCLRAF